MSAKPSESEWKDYIAIGVMCFLILTGIGGCLRIANSDNKSPLISITTQP